MRIMSFNTYKNADMGRQIVLGLITEIACFALVFLRENLCFAYLMQSNRFAVIPCPSPRFSLIFFALSQVLMEIHCMC